MELAKPRILLLFSDTGGGHRSAAEAINQSINSLYPGKVDIKMVDIVRIVGRTPLNKIPDIYPWAVRLPKAWEFSYKITDTKLRSKIFRNSLSLYSKKRLQNFVRDNPCDLIVSTHFGANALLDYLPAKGPKLISIITDLVSAHRIWYDEKIDLCIFPTQIPYKQAISEGMKPSQAQVVGLPVSSQFKPSSKPKQDIKSDLSWPTKKPVVMVMGGGFGHGQIEEIVKKLCKNYNKFSIIVVAGRNNKLRRSLDGKRWAKTVKVYGFVKNIAEMMQASDILITKAGSLTIAEAFSVGVPLILYEYLPGQEEGNVIYLTEKNAGVYSAEPERIASIVDEWLNKPSKLKKISQASLNLSQADVADKIAKIIIEKLKLQQT